MLVFMQHIYNICETYTSLKAPFHTFFNSYSSTQVVGFINAMNILHRYDYSVTCEKMCTVYLLLTAITYYL